MALGSNLHYLFIGLGGQFFHIDNPASILSANCCPQPTTPEFVKNRTFVIWLYKKQKNLDNTCDYPVF